MVRVHRTPARVGCAADPHVNVKVCARYSPRKQTVYRQATYAGAMRKHSGWRVEHQEALLSALDTAAHRKVAPASATGYLVRKAAR